MLDASEYSHFVNGGVYNEDVVLGSSGLSVKSLVMEYPNDWEEVLVTLSPTGSGNIYVTPVTKIFTDAEVVTLITFLNDNFEDFVSSINHHFSEITLLTFKELKGECLYEKADVLIDKLEANNTPLTEAEKVTIITFLNDNYWEFVECIWVNRKYNSSLDGVTDSSDSKAYYLIDKIERS